MKTKTEITAALKAKPPVLRVGNDDDGYTELDAQAYEVKITEWTDAVYAEEVAQNSIIAQRQALLARLGITADEAKLLLS